MSKPTKTIKASEVREGQRVTIIHNDHGPTDYIDKRWGRYPHVTRATFREHGENGHPTVYLTLSDDADGTYCLRPDELVTVEARS